MPKKQEEKHPKEKHPKEKHPKEKHPKEKSPKEKSPKEKSPKGKGSKEKRPKDSIEKNRKEETAGTKKAGRAGNALRRFRRNKNKPEKAGQGKTKPEKTKPEKTGQEKTKPEKIKPEKIKPEKKPRDPKAVRAMLLQCAAGAILGMGLGFFGYTALEQEFRRADGPVGIALVILKTLVGLVLSYYLQITIHEGGHLLFGLSTGYRFCSFRIGSLILVRKNRRFYLRRYQVPGTAGQCLLDPPDWNGGKVPFVLYHLGGVILNVVSVFIFWKLSLVSKGKNTFLSALMMVNALAAVALALLNGIPMDGALLNNDGSNTLYFSRHPKSLRPYWLIMKVNAAQCGENRLRDMPDEWFDQTLWENSGDHFGAMMAYTCFCRMIDELDFEEAERLGKKLQKDDTILPGLLRYSITSDLLYLELVGENRREEVEKYRTKDFLKFAKSMKTSPSILRMEYAYQLLGRNDADAAERKRAEFEKAAARHPNACEIEGERELLEYADHCQEDIGVELTDAEQLEIELIEQNRFSVTDVYGEAEDPFYELKDLYGEGGNPFDVIGNPHEKTEDLHDHENTEEDE